MKEEITQEMIDAGVKVWQCYTGTLQEGVVSIYTAMRAAKYRFHQPVVNKNFDKAIRYSQIDNGIDKLYTVGEISTTIMGTKEFIENQKKYRKEVNADTPPLIDIVAMQKLKEKFGK